MRNFEPITVYSYHGGQNDSDEVDQLSPIEGQLMQNCYIRKIGAIEKRSGIDEIGVQTNTHAVDLDLATSQYLSITDGDQTGLNITGDIKIEFWMKLTQLPSVAGNYYNVVSKYLASGDQRSYRLQIRDTDDTFLFEYTSSGAIGTKVQIEADTAFDSDDVGEWIHCAIAIDVSSYLGEFYKDGVAQGMTNIAGTQTAIYDGTADFCIGTTDGATDYSDMQLDELRIWSDIRTETEINDNMDKQILENEANLAGYWRFNNSLLDETSNNNDLTNNNTATFVSTGLPFTTYTFDDEEVLGMGSFKEDDGTKWLFMTAGTSLYYLNGSRWSCLDDGFTDSQNMEFEVANNKVYMINGQDNMHSFDGADTTRNSSLTDMGNAAIPKGKYIAWWKNYMFVCGDAVLDGTKYPQRVYFSDLNDPDTYTHATNWFDVNKSDGQLITGMAILEDFLIIFKEKSIWVMTGDSPDDWKITSSNNNLTNVEQGVGCVSHRSIVQVGNDIWFMANDGIRSVKRNDEGTTPSTGIVSGNLNTTIAGLNKSQLSKVSSILFNKRVYFAVPNGTSTFNNLVMVADTTIILEKPYNPHPWVIYTGWEPSCWIVYTSSNEPELYFGEADTNTLVLKAETGTSDNEIAIDFDYKGSMIDLKEPHTKKLNRFMYVSGESGGDYDVSIQTSPDGNIFTEQDNLNLSSGAEWDSGVWGTDTWGYRQEKREKITLQLNYYQIQARFRNNQADEPIKMYPYTFAVKPKKFK